MKPFRQSKPTFPEGLDPEKKVQAGLYARLGFENLIEQVSETKAMSLMESLKNFLNTDTTQEIERKYDMAFKYDSLHNEVWDADLYNGHQKIVNEMLRKIELVKRHYALLHDYATKHGFIDYMMYPYPTGSNHADIDVCASTWRGYFTWFDLFNSWPKENYCLTFGYDLDYLGSRMNLYFHYRADGEILKHETPKGLTINLAMEEKPPVWFLEKVKSVPKSTEVLREMFRTLDIKKSDMEFLSHIPDKLLFP